MPMNSLSAMPLPLPAANVSTPSPSTPGPSTPEANAANAARSQAHPFADMLRQRQAATPAPVKAVLDKPVSAAPTSEPVPNAGDTTAASSPKVEGAARLKRAMDPKAPARVEPPGDDSKAASPAVGKEAKDTKDTPDPIGVAHGIEPAQCPIDLGLDAITRKAAATAADAEGGDAAADGAKSVGKGATWAADAQAAAADATARATAKVGDAIATDRSAVRADATGETAELAKHAVLDERSGRVDPPTSAPASFASTLAQLNGSSTAAAAPVDVALATPMNAPEFAQALGMQVSLLVADGVQRAELHLNPADMGPVSIEITLNGTQAQVDFGADLATTRHAIEAGLPELASALQDAGFTLHGGGVSQHSARQGGGDPGDHDRSFAMGGRGAAANAAAPVAPAARARVAMTGGVDVYA